MQQDSRPVSLSSATERVAKFRALVSTGRAPYLIDLAFALDDLGLELLGSEGALAPWKESVAIYRELIAAGRQEFLPNLADIQGCLAGGLDDFFRYEEALEMTKEATATYRQLVERDGAKFLPKLGGSLGGLADRFLDAGRPEDALQARQEQVSVYRQLASQRPSDFACDLAWSLIHASEQLLRISRPIDALRPGKEGTRLLQNVYAQTGDLGLLPSLALGLKTLHDALFDLQCYEQALQAKEQEIEIEREMAKRYDTCFLRDLAASLDSVQPVLRRLGRHEAALNHSEEAIGIYRDLNRVRHLSGLAQAMCNRGANLRNLSRYDEAIAQHMEAARLICAETDVYGREQVENVWRKNRMCLHFAMLLAGHPKSDAASKLEALDQQRSTTR